MLLNGEACGAVRASVDAAGVEQDDEHGLAGVESGLALAEGKRRRSSHARACVLMSAGLMLCWEEFESG